MFYQSIINGSIYMKYSILGFDQREVLNLTRIEMVNNKPTEVSIDIIDLLILSDVAELSNRNSIRKVILDNGQFSWISYNAILEDLPILKIEKKQLSRRLDKLESFGLIEMKVERVKGMGTFTYIRVGSTYESVKYSNDGQKSREGVVNNVYGGSQECPPKYTYTIQDNNKHKEEIDKSISQKKQRKKSFDVRADLSYVESAYADVWSTWLDYKDELKKQYKTQRGAMSAYSKFVSMCNGDIRIAKAIVSKSIENSWQGLFDLDERRKKEILEGDSGDAFLPVCSPDNGEYDAYGNRRVDGVEYDDKGRIIIDGKVVKSIENGKLIFEI